MCTRNFQVKSIHPFYLGEVLSLTAEEVVTAYSFWGGIPHYWELAASFGKNILEGVEAIVLDLLGPLHEKPFHLLLEGSPPATALRPVLDAIGLEVHKLSEIAGRLAQPVTSLNCLLERLRELELIEREVSFGVSEFVTKRALYKIGDPFCVFGLGQRRKKERFNPSV